ncbi:MAG TPA: WXG100 family type VII secretion target [Marmoricola sp.]|nr:WXG100 family type VII secretion target [Marmoricola sp.]
MAGEVSKQDGALNRGAQMVAAARGDLDQQLGSLRGKLSGIGAAWRGAGSSAFQQVMVRWNEDASKIIAALDEFEANLRSSEQTYNASDESQSSTFSKLSGRLG